MPVTSHELPNRPTSLVVVRTAHRTAYPNPIRLRVGDAVVVQRADDEYPGWHWCTGPDGAEGWVHESCLSTTTSPAAAVRNYSAVELTVAGGERGRVLETLGDWAYIQLEDSRVGWIPSKNIEVIA